MTFVVTIDLLSALLACSAPVPSAGSPVPMAQAVAATELNTAGQQLLATRSPDCGNPIGNPTEFRDHAARLIHTCRD